MGSKYYTTINVDGAFTSDAPGSVLQNLVSYIGVYIEITTDNVGRITQMKELHLKRDVQYTNSTGADTLQNYFDKNK